MSKIKQTFWHVISNYSIEIPTIQRDYTYGRTSAKTIRKKLIKTIFNALTTSDYLHLDFVYGKLKGLDNFTLLEKNKQSIDTLLHSLKNYANNLHLDVSYKTEAKNSNSSEIITFIPLDGQQRLTTLFLVHWYLAKKTNNDSAVKSLSRFTYATRNSSREFLQMLSEFPSQLIIENSSSISENITNHEQFFNFWKKDPTVNSMLVVLDEIDLFFKEVDYKSTWENLTLQNKITFDFFDLDDFNQTDELYVKMNARGKKLSHFENFKAWLIKSHSNNITVQDWKKKIDIQWNDLFWTYKPKKQTEVDTEYLQYFKNMFLGDYINQSDILDKNVLENIDKIRSSQHNEFLDIIQDSEIFKNNIHNYLSLLDIIDNDELLSYKINKSFLKISIGDFILKDNNSYNWPEATLYYALSRYLIKNKDVKEIKTWLRVASNLLFNTTIESPKLYKEACVNMEELNFEPFTELLLEKLHFYSNTQVKEEIEKHKLEKSNHNWIPIFTQLEQNKYFFGQIGFLLDTCNTSNLEEFNTQSQKINYLFSDEILGMPYLLNRLFLSFKVCFMHRGANQMIYSNNTGTLRIRNENWRIAFTHYNDVLKSIIENDVSSIKKIEQLIESNIKTKDLPKYLVVLLENKSLFNYMIKRCLRIYDNRVLLLSSTRIYGYHVELFTYDYFLKNQDKYDYFYSKNEEEIPGVKDKITEDIITYDLENDKYFSLNQQEVSLKN